MWSTDALDEGVMRWYYGGEEPGDSPPAPPHPGEPPAPAPERQPPPERVREPDETREPAVREPRPNQSWSEAANQRANAPICACACACAGDAGSSAAGPSIGIAGPFWMSAPPSNSASASSALR